MTVERVDRESTAQALGVPSIGGRRSLREEVAHALRAALVSGQMRPGRIYSTPSLAEEFGVSATPVREALLDLVKKGLVEVAPDQGFRVRALSERELDEITEVRRYLEVPGTARCIEAMTPTAMTSLRRLAARIVEAAKAKDLIAFVESDRRFHLELLTVAGNEALVELVGSLRARARLFGIAGLAESGELRTSAEEHVAIIDLIEAGDREVSGRDRTGASGHDLASAARSR